MRLNPRWINLQEEGSRHMHQHYSNEIVADHSLVQSEDVRENWIDNCFNSGLITVCTASQQETD